eukprot:603085-Pelagomonas_calceolata.AAC.4
MRRASAHHTQEGELPAFLTNQTSIQFSEQGGAGITCWPPGPSCPENRASHVTCYEFMPGINSPPHPTALVDPMPQVCDGPTRWQHQGARSHVCVWFVMDVGNTKGSLSEGPACILAAIGGPVLKPGSPTYVFAVVKNVFKRASSGVRAVLVIFRQPSAFNQRCVKRCPSSPCSVRLCDKGKTDMVKCACPALSFHH